MAVVIPVRNEEALLPELLACLNDLRLALDRSVTVIFVDDGSTDRTPEILSAGECPWMIHLRNPRHTGQHRSVLRGLAAALDLETVEAVATADADMDPPPSALVTLLPYLASHDLVVGGRTLRTRTKGRSAASWFLRVVCRRLSPAPITDHGSMFRLFSRSVATRCVELQWLGSCLAGLSLLAASNPVEVPLPPSSSRRSSRYTWLGLGRVAADTLLLWARARGAHMLRERSSVAVR